MALDKTKYWLVAVFYTLFIFVSLPFTPALWRYLQDNFGYLPLYSIYFIYLSGTISILAYLSIVSREKEITIYLNFVVIAIIFGYYLQTIANPAEKIHLIEYALLSFFIAKAFQLGSTRNRYMHYCYAFLLITLIGFLDECFQYYLPNRFFDIKDIFINSLAGFLGLAYLRLIVYRQSGDSPRTYC